jgi:hypothetical protein
VNRPATRRTRPGVVFCGLRSARRRPPTPLFPFESRMLSSRTPAFIRAPAIRR